MRDRIISTVILAAVALAGFARVREILGTQRAAMIAATPILLWLAWCAALAVANYLRSINRITREARRIAQDAAKTNLQIHHDTFQQAIDALPPHKKKHIEGTSRAGLWLN